MADVAEMYEIAIAVSRQRGPSPGRSSAVVARYRTGCELQRALIRHWRRRVRRCLLAGSPRIRTVSLFHAAFRRDGFYVTDEATGNDLGVRSVPPLYDRPIRGSGSRRYPGLFLRAGRSHGVRRDRAPHPQAGRRAAFPSTAWPSCCARPSAISRWWRRRCGGPAFRLTSAGASAGRILPDELFFLLLRGCALENCSASRFAEYLSLGQVPTPGDSQEKSSVSDDEIQTALRGETPSEPESPEAQPQPSNDTDRVIAGTLQAPSQWEHLLIDASVIGGSSAAEPVKRLGSRTSRSRCSG